ncbi:MAG: PHP domain-containing protein [Bacteroidetes bacterium]|nr:PHP domain-containing protein [Bacteroidota bacterium]
MKEFRADLHIHTVLSPCGQLDMSPDKIVKQASDRKLHIIGITDHNSTHHCKLIRKIAEPLGIFVMMGAEITTKEEVHCLAFFETDELLDKFQEYLDEHLPHIPNDPERFGYQVIVDENEIILKTEEWLLISALDQSIEQVESMVHELGGIFIPAHIDKGSFSLFSQLGFIPKGLKADAFEISPRANSQAITPLITGSASKTLIRNSDAHLLELIGSVCSIFRMEYCSFKQIRTAIETMNISI